MIEQVPIPADNVIGFRIQGKINTDDISLITKEIEARLERHSKLRIYAEVDGLAGMTMKALLKDIAFSLRHFRDFEREAIVSDAAWLKKLAVIGDRVVPGIEVRHFYKSERDDALEWIIQRS